MIELHPKKKKKGAKIVFGIGLAFLLLGLLPGFVSWWLGLIFFVFCSVAAGVLYEAIPSSEEDPLPEKNTDDLDGKKS